MPETSWRPESGLERSISMTLLAPCGEHAAIANLEPFMHEWATSDERPLTEPLSALVGRHVLPRSVSLLQGLVWDRQSLSQSVSQSVLGTDVDEGIHPVAATSYIRSGLSSHLGKTVVESQHGQEALAGQ